MHAASMLPSCVHTRSRAHPTHPRPVRVCVAGLSQRAHAAFLLKYRLSGDEIPLLTMTRSLTNLFVTGTKFGDGPGGDPTGSDRSAGWMTRPPFTFGEWSQG